MKQRIEIIKYNINSCISPYTHYIQTGVIQNTKHKVHIQKIKMTNNNIQQG